MKKHTLFCRSALCALCLGLAAARTAVAAPANDNFASRTTLTGATVNTTGDNTDATLQAGEVDPGEYGGTSVWYQWTAPATGWVTIHTVADVIATQLDTVVAVFTGTTFASLQMLGHNDESLLNEPFGASRIVFQATAGTAYQIAVHGYFSEEGPFELHIAPQAEPVLRVDALTISPTAVNVTTAARTVSMTATLSAAAGSSVEGASFSAGPNLADHYNVVAATLSRTSGNASNGLYQGTLTVPRYVPPGSWPVTVTISSEGEWIDWSPRGRDLYEDHYLLSSTISSLFTVTNTGVVDTSPATISAITGIPPTVTLTGTDVSFDVSMRIQDSPAGFDWGSFSPLGFGDTSFAGAQRISGTAQDGVYRVTLTIPADTPSGEYFPSVGLLDAALNEIWRSDDPGGDPDFRLSAAGSNLSIIVTRNAGPTGFAAWQQSAFTAAELAITATSGPIADPDGDTIPNLVEYALGLAPKAPNPVPWTPELRMIGPSLHYALRIRVPVPMPSGVRLAVEDNPALSQPGWEELGYADSQGDDALTATPALNGFREVVFGLPAQPATRRYLRVTATIQ